LGTWGKGGAGEKERQTSTTRKPGKSKNRYRRGKGHKHGVPAGKKKFQVGRKSNPRVLGGERVLIRRGRGGGDRHGVLRSPGEKKRGTQGGRGWRDAK